MDEFIDCLSRERALLVETRNAAERENLSKSPVQYLFGLG